MSDRKVIYMRGDDADVLARARELFPDQSQSRILWDALREKVEREEASKAPAAGKT